MNTQKLRSELKHAIDVYEMVLNTQRQYLKNDRDKKRWHDRIEKLQHHRDTLFQKNDRQLYSALGGVKTGIAKSGSKNYRDLKGLGVVKRKSSPKTQYTPSMAGHVTPSPEISPIKKSPAADPNSPFVRSDRDLPKTTTFRLPGPMGDFFGDLERYRLLFPISGVKGCGKTQFLMQLANAFADMGLTVAIWLLETGAGNNVVANYRDRHISPENMERIFFSGDGTLEDIRANMHRTDVVFIDSWSELYKEDGKLADKEDFRALRNDFENNIIGTIFHANQNGTLKGGSSYGHMGGLEIKGFSPDGIYKNNYFKCTKNRYGSTSQRYYHNSKVVVDEAEYKLD